MTTITRVAILSALLGFVPTCQSKGSLPEKPQSWDKTARGAWKWNSRTKACEQLKGKVGLASANDFKSLFQYDVRKVCPTMTTTEFRFRNVEMEATMGPDGQLVTTGQQKVTYDFGLIYACMKGKTVWHATVGSTERACKSVVARERAKFIKEKYGVDVKPDS